MRNNYEVVEEHGDWVLEQDNQLFRQIRRITGNHGKQNNYIFFVDGRAARRNAEALLYALDNGIMLEGRKFVAAERSASMVRQAVFSFVDATIYDELSEIIGNGVQLEETVISKYMAYRALLMSSCFCLEDYLPKIIVCDDYYYTVPEQKIRYLATTEKEYVDKDGKLRHVTQEELREGETDVRICPADGAGIMHPQVAAEIRSRLSRDNKECRGTSFMLRAPFIKGVVHEIDYTRFYQERGIEYITDLWGEKHDVREPMIILTKSQYKCFGYYKKYGDARDFRRYWDNFKKYHHCLGVAKWNYSADEEPIYTRCNYQVLQTLDMPTDDFLALADYSRRWVERILAGDPIYLNAFLGLFADHQKPSNDYVRAILRNPEMVKEKTVQKYLRSLLEKRTNDMACGKIYLKSTFRIIAPDLIALMESLAGLPVEGCLEADECWSQGVAGPNLGRKLLTRNPHISASENVVLTGVNKPIIQDYAGHLEGVTMVNGKSIILQRWNGADVDGDLLLEFDDPRLLDGVDNELRPVIDLEDKKPALSEPISRASINAYIIRTLDNRIGEYSNIATCYHNKDYSRNERCEQLRQFAVDAIDFISVLNGREIDSAKTGVKYLVPRHISKRAKPFPYFMKYASDYYARHKNLNRSRTNMNNLCFEIEHWAKELEYGRRRKGDFDWRIMVDESIPFDPEKYAKVEALHKSFSKEMQEHSTFLYKNRQEALREFGYDFDCVKNFELDYGYYYAAYEGEARTICCDLRELANYAVRSCYEHKSWNPKFMWVVAAQGILDNIVPQPVMLPEESDFGTEYLGRKYVLKEVRPID